MVKLIQKAAYAQSTWQIWDDLIYMSAAALSQPCQWVQEREDEYFRRFNRYDKPTQELFPQMLAEIVNALQQEGCEDILGDVYMQLELYNKWRGQYFTPGHICDLMTKILYSDLAGTIEKQGYISVSDPCCGGGAMLIAFAKNCVEQNINYQESVLFVGQDIDPVVARMCYIQMSLLGMPGYVIIGNTLAPNMDSYDYWYTPMYFVGRWAERERAKRAIDAFKSIIKESSTADREVVDDSFQIANNKPALLNVTLKIANDSYDIELRETESGQLQLIF